VGRPGRPVRGDDAGEQVGEQGVGQLVGRGFQERRPLGRLFQRAGDLAVVQFELDHGVQQRQEAFAGWRGRAQWWRAVDDCDHQAGDPRVEDGAQQARPVAEAAEQGALADAGRGGDIVHRDRQRIVGRVEQGARGGQDGPAVAGGVGAFLDGHVRNSATAKSRNERGAVPVTRFTVSVVRSSRPAAMTQSMPTRNRAVPSGTPSAS